LPCRSTDLVEYVMNLDLVFIDRFALFLSVSFSSLLVHNKRTNNKKVDVANKQTNKIGCTQLKHSHDDRRV